VRTQTKGLTQAQLIARALDNEEGNLRQHRNYLRNEEERRKRAQVVRPIVQGPLLRWISKEGEDKVPLATKFVSSHYSAQVADASTQPPEEPQFETRLVTRNYVVHELGQSRSTLKPTWTQSMKALFGDQVEWDKIKVYVGKNRPLGICYFFSLGRPSALTNFSSSDARLSDYRAGCALFRSTDGCSVQQRPGIQGVNPVTGARIRVGRDTRMLCQLVVVGASRVTSVGASEESIFQRTRGHQRGSWRM